MRKWRLTRKARVAALATLVAIGIVVALVFYVRAFQDAGSNYPVALPTDDNPAAGPSRGPSAPSKHPRKHAHGTPEASRSGPPAHGVHTLVAHVESAEPIGVIGYLVPTSPDLSFGKAKHVGKSWTVRTRVTGRPKYAIIWIKGAKDGTSVSCSITIDGKVVDRQRTKGPSGLQACSA
jgi:hypothetical protein